ncbi:MAG: hypothetical protein KGI25_01720 [Thaumarchaeota archaeon]|nr:hypothetical protein [Nitrososphaerota archaeon]
MDCEDEYNEITRTTERLHELYYQQETVEFAFSNALANAQNYLIDTGLVRLATATAAEIVNALEDSYQEGFAELHDAAASKVQIDAAVISAEEAYRDASKRYEECIKRQSEKMQT